MSKVATFDDMSPAWVTDTQYTFDAAAVSTAVFEVMQLFESPSSTYGSLARISQLSNERSLRDPNYDKLHALIDFAVLAAEGLGYDVSPDSGCLPRSLSVCAALVRAGFGCRWHVGLSRHAPAVASPLHAWAETPGGRGIVAYALEEAAEEYAVIHSQEWPARE